AGLISSSGHYRCSLVEARVCCPYGRDSSAYFWCLIHSWQTSRRKPSCRHHFFGPAAVSHVQHQCSRRVCDIYCMLACQAEPNVVFRQKHPPKSLPDLWFVVSHPQQLRESEICERWIAGEFDDSRLAQLRIEPIALFLSALVAPDQRRPKGLIILIEQNRAMHLPSQSSRFDICGRNACGRNRFPNS